MSVFFLYEFQNLRVLKYVGEEKKAAWGKHWIELGFNSTSSIIELVANCTPVQVWRNCCTGLEKLLETTAGKYSVGDEV